VSSTYSIFCMSHDPAIDLPDLPGVEESIEWARDGFGPHPSCDLLVGRYSGGLIEVGCPGAREPGITPGHRGHSGWHRDTIWADAALLRVAAAALEEEWDGRSTAIQHALAKLPMCWTLARLHRLRDILGVKP
jgi:hypothetical protein